MVRVCGASRTSVFFFLLIGFVGCSERMTKSSRLRVCVTAGLILRGCAVPSLGPAELLQLVPRENRTWGVCVRGWTDAPDDVVLLTFGLRTAFAPHDPEILLLFFQHTHV